MKIRNINSGLILLIMTLVFIVGCQSTSSQTEDKISTECNQDLVFLGTIKDIQISSIPQSLTNWVVTFRVDKIISGSFSGKTFSIRIHSPAKSSLEVGKQYKVEAKRTSDGYSVDQYQWMKAQ